MPRATAPQPVRRRARGTGSVRWDRGRWRARITLADPRTGQDFQHSKDFQERRDAEDWLDDLIRRRRGGRAVTGRTEDIPVLADWMTEWLRIQVTEGAGGRGLSDSTSTGYQSAIRDWIAPTDLGGMRLDHITATNIREWLEHLRTAPTQRPRRLEDGTMSRHLSQHRQLYIWRVLRHAMTDAVVREFVTADPMLGVSPPSTAGDSRRQASGSTQGASSATHTISDEQGQAMTRADLRRVIVHLHATGCAHEDDVCALRWLLALNLGLRQGEALGLGWSSVDLSADEPVIHVVRHLRRVMWRHGEDCGATDEVDAAGEVISECGHVQGQYCSSRRGGGLHLLRGTKAGVDRTRSLGLDDDLVDAFTVHKKAQSAELRRARRRSDFDPLDPSHVGLVFTSLPRGRAVAPEADKNAWQRMLRAAGVDRPYRLHDARHTAATLIVNSGIDLATAKDVLGHAQIATTALYVWTDVSATRRAVSAVSGALRSLRADDSA